MITTSKFIHSGLVACAISLGLGNVASAAAPTVLTVPWIPSSPTTPHTTYPTSSTTEASIILVATVPSAVGSADSYTVSWNFGDGTANASFAMTNPYDISTSHQYPATAAVGTQWTAVVTDTTTNQSGTGKYYVIQEANTLSFARKRCYRLGLVLHAPDHVA